MGNLRQSMTQEEWTALGEMSKPQRVQNTTEKRPWGYFTVLLDSALTKVKKIVVHPRQKLSYQYHTKRQEHWTIISGNATIILDDIAIEKSAGESIHIPLGAKHRICNNHTNNDLIFIEVQTGSYFGEDDIIRLDDDYGR